MFNKRKPTSIQKKTDEFALFASLVQLLFAAWKKSFKLFIAVNGFEPPSADKIIISAASSFN